MMILPRTSLKLIALTFLLPASGAFAAGLFGPGSGGLVLRPETRAWANCETGEKAVAKPRARRVARSTSRSVASGDTSSESGRGEGSLGFEEPRESTYGRGAGFTDDTRRGGSDIDTVRSSGEGSAFGEGTDPRDEGGDRGREETGER